MGDEKPRRRRGGGGASHGAAVKQQQQDSHHHHQSEAEKKEAAAVYAKIVFGIVAYASCSSMMLIINKLAVTFLPAPSVVLFCQLLTSAVAIKAMHEGGVVESDPLVAEKVKPFMLVAIAFLGALYTNVKTCAIRKCGDVHRVSIVDADYDCISRLRVFRETITEPAKLVIADGDLDGRDCVRVYGFEL